MKESLKSNHPKTLSPQRVTFSPFGGNSPSRTRSVRPILSHTLEPTIEFKTEDQELDSLNSISFSFFFFLDRKKWIYSETHSTGRVGAIIEGKSQSLKFHFSIKNFFLILAFGLLLSQSSGSRGHRLSSCSSSSLVVAHGLSCMWIKSRSPALKGGFLTTRPSGKSPWIYLFCIYLIVYYYYYLVAPGLHRETRAFP